jgi:predicted lactoylglutathione lyase
MPKSIFINLPVKDIKVATAFYEAIGCTRNDQFSDENSSSMVWSETTTFQLLQHDYYRTFTNKPIADAHASSGMLIALSRDSRQEVDQMVEAAGKAGGQVDVREPQDLGFMYLRSFADPDGHVFEPAHLDMNAAG